MSSPHERRSAIRQNLSEVIDGLLVTSLSNIRYLSGFSGSNAALYIGHDEADDVICTDGRYATSVLEECGGLPVIIDRASAIGLVEQLIGGGVCRLGVEDCLPLSLERVITSQVQIEVTSGLVEALREVKDPGEFALIEQACQITAAALSAMLTEIRVGLTEIWIARRLEQLFGEWGADDRAFETIVGAGPHSAIPHHQPSDRPLQAGDLLVIDAGAMVGGYRADMTRTAVVAHGPADWQLEIHGLVLAAQQAGQDACSPLNPCVAVDFAARSLIDGAGFGGNFGHGLGHGLGLDIHEAPMLNARATGTLSTSTTVTIEPGVYLPSRGGVRIEDTFLVESGGARVLTQAPRDLIVVG